MQINLTFRHGFSVQDVVAVCVAFVGGAAAWVNGAVAVIAIFAALFLEVVNIKVRKEVSGVPRPGTYGERGKRKRGRGR
jgi:hypothetical protein